MANVENEDLHSVLLVVAVVVVIVVVVVSLVFFVWRWRPTFELWDRNLFTLPIV